MERERILFSTLSFHGNLAFPPAPDPRAAFPPAAINHLILSLPKCAHILIKQPRDGENKLERERESGGESEWLSVWEHMDIKIKKNKII